MRASTVVVCEAGRERGETGIILHETSSLDGGTERAVLVGAPTKDLSAREAEEHLDELARLADTAGAEVVGTVSQWLDSPHPRYYIGEGKAKELKQRLVETGAELVLFDEDLTPAQGRNLENRTGVRVMDRTELILDIFAKRARSREARMQVELAQLEYLRPRLKRMWTHLSRTRGGIGLRGPGETQLETDRRLIGRRIRDLRGKLEGVAQRRATQRKGRSDEFRVALVGYTNAGKSSILRSLSGAELFVENRLFATLDPTTRVVELEGGERALVTDTVGFIRKLPHHLVASFRATIEEARDADLVLHVVDVSHRGREEQTGVVDEVLADMGLWDQPRVVVFNKIDRLTHVEEEALRERASAVDGGRAVFTSTVEDGGLEELRDALHAELRARRPAVKLRIPVVDGEALAAVYREGEVIRREARGTTIDLVARLPEAAVGRLRQRVGVRIDGAS